jgi:pSer/pThr/pTyr-binding forkhead associated (FHA) protein
MLCRTTATLFERPVESSAFFHRLDESRRALSGLTSPPASAFLLAIPASGESVGSPDYKIIQHGLTVGRSAQSDWQVADLRTKLSGLHFRVISTADGYLLQDLNSTNGTYVNENTNPIRQASLCDGDVIHAGGRKFLFCQGSAETD